MRFEVVERPVLATARRLSTRRESRPAAADSNDRNPDASDNFKTRVCFMPTLQLNPAGVYRGGRERFKGKDTSLGRSRREVETEARRALI